MEYSVLLDTAFLIRLLNANDPLHHNAVKYFEKFIDQEIVLKVSTISIAEYCVKGVFTDLPFSKVQVVPFNINHAKRAALFAKTLFEKRNQGLLSKLPRAIIPNDTKLFAQADMDNKIDYFATSDTKSIQAFDALQDVNPMFKIIDIHKAYHEFFGVLDL